MPANMRSTLPVVSFAERDHVLEAVYHLLGGPSPVAQRSIARFFAPEMPKFDELFDACRLPSPATLRYPLDDGDNRIGADTEVLVVRRREVSEELIASLPRLRHVQKLGTRTDTVDTSAAQARNINVQYISRPSLEATADHALLMILAGLKDLPDLESELRAHARRESHKRGSQGAVAYNWTNATGRSLCGSTVGIVGLGEVGLLLAKRLLACGANVLWTSVRGQRGQRGVPAGLVYTELSDLLARSHAVSLHVPWVRETADLVDADFLDQMRRDGILVNVSRGAIVDEVALASALRNGSIRGACLDVFKTEPLGPDSPILGAPRTILTPHVAGGQRSLIVEELIRTAQGISNALNGEVAV
ncbi:MAG: hypothetical protein EOP24_39970 [Hyphomicrobiales bacterium]|nr:MAG: hypothetical protein EOP24_39970 [Hyphomicrobiales bacterium]